MPGVPTDRRGGQRLIGAALLALTILGTACRSGDTGDPARAVPEPTESPLVFTLPAAPTPEPTPAADAEAAEPSPTPAPRFPAPREDAAPVRLLIDKAKVDAPFQTKSINARREMESPDGKDVVAWYDFSDRPGFGSNAVFSGHVDWYTGERGVFWYLKDLKPDDEIVLRLSDGMELRYRVTRTEVYKAETAPVAELVGPTTLDTLTLITCEGVFSRATRDYSDRRVVRAERTG